MGWFSEKQVQYCIHFSSCNITAFAVIGWEPPRFRHEAFETKSMYRFPSTSVTMSPSTVSTAIGKYSRCCLEAITAASRRVIQWIFEDSSYSRSPILKPIAVTHDPLPDSQCSCRRLPPLLWKRSTLEHPHCCHGGVPRRRSISHGVGSHKYTGRVCCCHKRS